MPASSTATAPIRPAGPLERHRQALWYVLTDIIPVILRTGKRPVIFSKYSGLGDIVCTFPAALELKKRHPGAHFIYNCHAEFTCLPRLGGIATHTTSLVPIGLIGYWYRFLLAGFYHFASDDDHPERTPSDVYIKDFGRPFGLDIPDDHPRLQIAPSVRERVQSLLRSRNLSLERLIVIHAGPSWPVREWPQESWINLIHELTRHGDYSIVQLGTSSHLAMGNSAAPGIEGALSFIDQLDLEESATLISLGALFVGIDSGLLHLAACLKIPSVGLWGPTSSEFRFSAYNRRLFITSPVDCQGCHHRTPRLHWMTNCPYDIKCMKAIDVPDVLRACLAGLAEQGKNQPS